MMDKMAPPLNIRKRRADSRPPKKNRRFRNVSEEVIKKFLCDSGSDDDDEDKIGETNQKQVRNLCARLRTGFIELEEAAQLINERSDGVNKAEEREKENARLAGPTAAASVDTNFVWSADFTSFTGQKEVYSRVPGPSISSQNPVDIFQEIWDPAFMATVAAETNLYAWEVMAQLSDPVIGPGIPDYMKPWVDVTVEELYRYLAIIIYMSFCYRTKIRDYWKLGTLGMPGFRDLIARNRFLLISRFLHFVSNSKLSSRGHDRKIEKIASVLDHCNRKFAALYTPSQHLSLDESLLLWKGRLSWKQCIRSKDARFGIKTLELCEAETGYLLQSRVYTGKQDEIYPDTSHGSQNHTAKVVLDLIDGYLDVGHVLVMDNWYNQLPLTRYLKARRTDVLSTVSRLRLPRMLKDLNPDKITRGTNFSLHSGDIALVAWKDVKLVTVLSTFHKHSMVPERRGGQKILKPVAVTEYNKYMGGVDLKDQKISMFLMERKRNMKWYMKLFRRLVNISLLNAYIIYTKNPMFQVFSHSDFRYNVAEGLISRYPIVSSGPSRVPNRMQYSLLRLKPGQHFPIYTAPLSGPRKGNKRLRCVRCNALKKRVDVKTVCKFCDVPLCIGQCWSDYHNLINLD